MVAAAVAALVLPGPSDASRASMEKLLVAAEGERTGGGLTDSGLSGYRGQAAAASGGLHGGLDITVTSEDRPKTHKNSKP